MPTGWKGPDYVSGLAATLISVCCVAMTGVGLVMYLEGFIDVIQYIAILVIFLGSEALMLCAARSTEENLARELRGLWRKWREFWRGVLK